MGHALARLPLPDVTVNCPDCDKQVTVHQAVVVTSISGRENPVSTGNVQATYEHTCTP